MSEPHFPNRLATTADVEATRPDLPLDARVAQVVIREIVAGLHQPGSFIREVELAARLGVSRPRVREALRNVYRAGFVRVEPWRGAQVASISSKETRYLLDLMEANFSVVGALAAENFPDSLFHVLDEELDLLRAAVRAGSLDQRVALSFRLARTLSRNCSSLIADDLLTKVGNLVLWQHRFLAPDDLEPAERSLAMMEALVAAVRARDPDVAADCARNVIRITKRALLAAMPTD